MAKKNKPRNRAAQDATLINLRALQKRVAALERRFKALKVIAGKTDMPIIRYRS